MAKKLGSCLNKGSAWYDKIVFDEGDQQPPPKRFRKAATMTFEDIDQDVRKTPLIISYTGLICKDQTSLARSKRLYGDAGEFEYLHMAWARMGFCAMNDLLEDCLTLRHISIKVIHSR